MKRASDIVVKLLAALLKGWQLLTEPVANSVCQEPADSFAGYIETMKAVEERSVEYEIGK